MMDASFKFREFIPASKQTSVQDDVPPVIGEEICAFYEELISSNHCDNWKSTPEVRPNVPSKNRASMVQRPSKSISDSREESSRSAQVSMGYFFQCAQNGDLVGLRRCFEEGLFIDARDPYGWTALMCAASSGSTRSVKFLLEHGADRKVFDKSGVTPLRLARIGGYQEILLLLLDSTSQSKNCIVKVEREDEKKADPVSDTRIENEHFCDLCKATIHGMTREKHMSSMLHQFAGHKAGAFACGTQYHIPESNVGFQIMVKEGWNKSDGLGPTGSGMKYPPKTVLKRGRDGLGSNLKAKAKITHFGPGDVNAVKHQKSSRMPSQAGISKRERLEKERIDKIKEIEFRRMWKSQD